MEEVKLHPQAETAVQTLRGKALEIRRRAATVANIEVAESLRVSADNLERLADRVAADASFSQVADESAPIRVGTSAAHLLNLFLGIA